MTSVIDCHKLALEVVGDMKKGSLRLEIAKSCGIKKMFAYILDDNAGMLYIFKKFKFIFRKEGEMFRVELLLDPVTGL